MDIPGIKLVGLAQDALGVFTQIRSVTPDLIVLDMALARELKTLPGIHSHQPRVLLMATQRHIGIEPPFGRDCACGFVRDRSSVEHIRTMLRVIANCRDATPGSSTCGQCPVYSSLNLPRLPLSEREYQVFERIGYGEGNSDIAGDLGLSVKTVETYRDSIKRKLGLTSAHELLRAALLWHSGDFVPDEALPRRRRNAELAH